MGGLSPLAYRDPRAVVRGLDAPPALTLAAAPAPAATLRLLLGALAAGALLLLPAFFHLYRIFGRVGSWGR